MVLENVAYRKWNWVDWDTRKKWIRSVSIGDYACYTDRMGSHYEGRIEMINNYGMDINTNGRYKFVHFEWVKSIRKTE